MRWINFTEVRGKKYQKGTKNKKLRRFQINNKLKELLSSIKPESPKSNDYVFISKNGTPIDNAGFIGNVWKGDAKGGIT